MFAFKFSALVTAAFALSAIAAPAPQVQDSTGLLDSAGGAVNTILDGTVNGVGSVVGGVTGGAEGLVKGLTGFTNGLLGSL